MIRKIEFTDSTNTKRAFSFTLPEDLTPSAAPDVSLSYLEDSDYLTDPDNGYINESGDPTQKLIATIKNVERINESTWEFAVTNVTRFDNRTIRDGKITGLPTYFDKWGTKSSLITGIGDKEDAQIIKIDQETNPDIMSKDLFLGNMSGFTTGFASGDANEVDYLQFLNPVNSDNVNNYYPVVNHGYLYDQEDEYYLYGNKQTEILNPESSSEDASGNVTYTVSGTPNLLSPIVVNMVNTTYQGTLSGLTISDFSLFKNNSFRDRFDILDDSFDLEYDHNLISEVPFVYLVGDDGELALPDVTILSKNEIAVNTYEEFHGYINVIRPNQRVRTFTIDTTTTSVNLAHGLNSVNIFAFITVGGVLGLAENAILDENTIFIPQLGFAGTVVVMDVSEYADVFDYPSFSSGVINHNLNLEQPGGLSYVDPWVFGTIATTPTKDEVVIADTTIIDKDNISVDFGETVSGVSIHIIDFWKLNQIGAVFQSKVTFNTDQFAFAEDTFFGNEGAANPFHKIYPPFEGQVDNIPCREYLVRAQTSKYQPRPLDFVSGYYTEEDILPTEPVYITESNELFIPNGISGTPVLTYEKEKAAAHEFRFRGTDVSPVSWYNDDRIIAIQPDDQELGEIELYSDVKKVNLTNASTRSLINQTTALELIPYNFNVVDGTPTNSSKLTVFATDTAGVALKDQVIELSSQRRLYKKVDSELVRLYDYSIEVVDNTNELFQLPSGDITGILSGTTVHTPSIFDEIQFLENPGTIDIYDDDGYLFTAMSETDNYRVPFIGSLFDEIADDFSHKIYKTTDIFGVAVSTIGYHNTPRADRIKTLRVTAYPSGQNDFNASIIDTDTILIQPYAADDTVGMIDTNGNPNPSMATHHVLPGDNVTILPSGTVPTTSTMLAMDWFFIQEASGVPARQDIGGIIDIYDTGEDYILELDYTYATEMASGVDPSYNAFESGTVVRYDKVDAPASIFERGEYYAT